MMSVDVFFSCTKDWRQIGCWDEGWRRETRGEKEGKGYLEFLVRWLDWLLHHLATASHQVYAAFEDFFSFSSFCILGYLELL